ncbi:hypothetical protein GCM10017600_88950 [Streptosporangium carneum]|uniref:Core-binding (CB) domain-containing protein n=1 Tax=Streptosporangium carneum TaxID=47481 RepID=A0A9W6IB81_9ACTN|nr:hypothetical protein GCM10017600_88950 [Streptosporangium carneum]
MRRDTRLPRRPPHPRIGPRARPRSESARRDRPSRPALRRVRRALRVLRGRRPGRPPAGDVDRALSAAARARVADGFATATGRAYARDWTAFTAWCATRGRPPLPATAETLAEYVTYLAAAPTRKGTLPAPSTVERALACIQSRESFASFARHSRAGVREGPRSSPRSALR